MHSCARSRQGALSLYHFSPRLRGLTLIQQPCAIKSKLMRTNKTSPASSAIRSKMVIKFQVGGHSYYGMVPKAAPVRVRGPHAPPWKPYLSTYLHIICHATSDHSYGPRQPAPMHLRGSIFKALAPSSPLVVWPDAQDLPRSNPR